MKANTSFTPNKKLILHFDVDSVLKLPTNQDKDYLVSQPLFRFTISAPAGFGVNSRKMTKLTLIKSQGGKLLSILSVSRHLNPTLSPIKVTWMTTSNLAKRSTKNLF